MFILIQMVNSNLANLAYRMLGSSVPLFTVETLLSAPEVVLHPPANELCKLMTQAMREVVEGLVLLSNIFLARYTHNITCNTHLYTLS